MEDFRLSEDQLNQIIDSLDETCGFLIKGNELSYWIEKFVNDDRCKREGRINQLLLECCEDALPYVERAINEHNNAGNLFYGMKHAIKEAKSNIDSI